MGKFLRVRRRPVMGAVIALIVAAMLGVVPQGAPLAQAQTAERITLAPRYVAQKIDSPAPAGGGQMGWLGIANAGDLDGDGKDDVLVPQYNGAGRIFVFSGGTGALIRTLTPPDPDLGGASNSAGNFVYPAKITDLASCSGGQTSQTCPLNPVGPPDGVPEILVGAPGVDIGGVTDLGRVYVFDGATGAVLKRVQMPPADIASETTRTPPRSFTFGRSVESPSSPYPATAPAAVKIGDLDGAGKADFVVGNPTFFESGPASNPSCDPGPCPGSGRVYFYRGEDVAGSDPNVVLDVPFKLVKNPMAQTGPEHERFGHATFPIGDVGRCRVDPGPGAQCPPEQSVAIPDGRPDVVIAAHQTEFPQGFDAGVTQLVDGATGAVLRMYSHPEPQSGALFGYSVGTMPTAIGDVGGTALPDVLVPAVAQNLDFVGQGRGYVLNGNFKASGSAVLSYLNDPTPNRGENFSAPFAGIGDVAGDRLNEVLVGAAGPWSPGDNRTFVNDVHVIDPTTQKPLLSLTDPDNQLASGFGQGVVPLGDLNSDGFMDFAVAAGFHSTDATLRAGRLYIFRSAAASPAPTTPVTAPAPTTAVPAPTGDTPAAPTGSTVAGYRLVASDGGIFAFGDARFLGSTGAIRLNQPIVGMASTPSGNGYWLVAADGGIFAFGDASFKGSTGAIRLNQPIVGMASTPSGNGYWLVAADGGIFAFGDASFKGSTGAIRLNQPIVGMASTPSGNGYWLVAADGGIFAFGDAKFKGSTGAIRLNQPIVGMDSTPSGDGYWLTARDGGIFAFGDAKFKGSTGVIRLNQPIVGMDSTPSGNGYWLTATDGGVFAFGDAVFAGSAGATRLNRPIVGMAARG